MEERREQCKIHEEKISKMSEKVDDIHRLLVGNGKIGLCAKVAILWYIGIFFVVRMAYLVWEIVVK